MKGKVGLPFHNRGAATGNARSPRRVLVRGTTNVAMSDDRSYYVLCYI